MKPSNGDRATIASSALAEAETLPAQPDQVGWARRFVVRHLSDHPCRGDAELVTSELVTNAVTYGRRASDGDTVVVALSATETLVRISVTDHGSQPPCVCRLGEADDGALGEDVADYGRGLMLLDRLVLLSGGEWGVPSQRPRHRGVGRTASRGSSEFSRGEPASGYGCRE